jgi:hypothetical protein
MRRAALAALAALFQLPALVGAQTFPERDLPPELRPWVAWVRDEAPDSVCPVVRGAAACLWPGRLDLQLAGSGGAFVFDAHADRTIDVRLPGDAQRWPEEVRVDGHPAAVLEGHGGPAVRVAAGAHRFEGRFSWSRLPDSLPVPPRLALVDVSIDGRRVTFPRRDEAGLVWLHGEDQAAGAVESLRLQAFRRIADGIPLWVETRLSLEVSGKAREVELVGALLPDSAPVAVRGGLPARLDSSGRLRVQVRAGTFAVTVLARLEEPVRTLAPPRVVEPWPSREVWAFAADEALRQVELSGLAPVDPSRTDLPPEWRSLPAYVVGPSSRLSLKEIRRGEAEPPPDRIQLQRQIWLDLSGQGFTVRDSFTGALSRTWRLDLAKPGELGRAALDQADQLITANPRTGAPGLELRRGALRLEADSRAPRSGRLPAVGWSADVEHLGATLNLPPGWWLLAATNVDRAPGAWTERWTLLGVFFVLIVAGATLRLFGRAWGVIALLAVGLTYDEPRAPFLVWLSLLGAIALAAVAPPGRLRQVARFWRGASLLTLILILAPFLRDQVRDALYPQVGGGGAQGLAQWPEFTEVGSPLVRARTARPPAAPPAATQPQAAPRQAEEEDKLAALGHVAKESAANEGGVAGGVVGGLNAPDRAKTPQSMKNAYQASSNSVALEQDPRAVLQTGPGVPQWSWRSYSLGWTGPVKADQTIRLWLISPGLDRVITFLRILLVLLFAAVLLAGTPSLRPTSGGVQVAVLLALGLLAPAAAASAGEAPPDRALLEEMKRRIIRPEPCQPNCISTSTLRVRLAGGALSFAAEVHAGDAGAWAIPGPTTNWAPTEVRVDGHATSALARLDDGFVYVRLPPGVHTVEVSGPAPRADTLTLQLRDRPHSASVDAPGWDVSGLRADSPPDTSIQLSRRLRAGEHAREESGLYAPWLEVHRTLSLGLTWRVRTEVLRVSPTGAPVSLRVPLVEGEAPTEPDLEVKDRAAVVSLGRDETETSWSSTLPVTESLQLQAAEGQPWSEVWSLECGLVWECESEGLVPVSHQAGGVLAPEFRPWPGETLRLHFRHPLAVAGQTVTLDAVRVETTPGERLTTTVLSLTARASREETVVLVIPADADVQEVTVAGASRPGHPDDGKLRVTLRAGSQAVVVRWREPRGMSLYQRVPSVGLPARAVNVESVLHLPENRWLLLTHGPSWGPAVLFWGYLIFALVVACGLGVFAETPLSLGAWLLLTLGLSQTSALEGVVVAGLFLVMGWRARRPRPSALAHDALQVLVAVWVLVALAVLYEVVQTGLLLRPDMQVAGAESGNTLLRWYSDRISDQGRTPPPGVLSLPLWTYRFLMLAWALWLAVSLLRWTGWMWRSFGEGGLWRPLNWPRRKPVAATSAPSGEGPGATTT